MLPGVSDLIITDGNRDLEISAINWPLAVDILIKFGVSETLLKCPHLKQLKVPDANLLSGELSAWGIPWKIIGFKG